MKRFYDSLLKPTTSQSENEIQYWRERIVAISLLVAAILGTLAYIVNLILSIQNQNWIWAALYTVLYTGLLIIFISTRLSYYLRSGILLAILYLLGIVSALQFGSAGDTRIWFIGFSILAGVLLGLRAGISATVISTASLLLLGLGITNDWIAPPPESNIVDPNNFIPWMSTSIPFFIIAVIAVFSIGTIINGLDKSLRTSLRLATELEKDHENLVSRSEILERRETQVRSAAEISRTISGELNMDQILSRVVNLIKERFNLYYVGVFLLDESGLYAVLREGTGDEGEAMLEIGHKLPVGGSSMIGWAIANRQAKIALDVGIEAVRFDNPHLPHTRSELALPMVSGERVLGALTIQSTRSEAFDEEDILVLQGVVDSLSTAINNARLFEQTGTNLRAIQRLQQQYLGEAWTKVVEESKRLSFDYEKPHYVSTQQIANAPKSRIEKPIVLRNQVIGKIVFETQKPSFNSEENAFIEAVIAQAALALDNARLVETTQRSAQQDRIVADLSSKVWASTDMDTILRTALTEMVQKLQAKDGIIHLDLSLDN